MISHVALNMTGILTFIQDSLYPSWRTSAILRKKLRGPESQILRLEHLPLADSDFPIGARKPHCLYLNLPSTSLTPAALKPCPSSLKVEAGGPSRRSVEAYKGSFPGEVTLTMCSYREERCIPISRGLGARSYQLASGHLKIQDVDYTTTSFHNCHHGASVPLDRQLTGPNRNSTHQSRSPDQRSASADFESYQAAGQSAQQR